MMSMLAEQATYTHFMACIEACMLFLLHFCKHVYILTRYFNKHVYIITLYFYERSYILTLHLHKHL